MKIKCYLNDSETLMKEALEICMSIIFLIKISFQQKKFNKGKLSIK